MPECTGRDELRVTYREKNGSLAYMTLGLPCRRLAIPPQNAANCSVVAALGSEVSPMIGPLIGWAEGSPYRI